MYFNKFIFQKYPYRVLDFLLKFDPLFMRKELFQLAHKLKEMCYLLTLAQPAYIKMQMTCYGWHPGSKEMLG